MKVLVAILDGRPDKSGDRLLPEGLSLQEDVPLTLEFKKDINSYLGRAKLIREGDKVYAELTFSNRDMRGKYHDLTPAVGGYCTDRAEDGILKKWDINEVSLSIRNNCDDRIRPLKEQEPQS